MATPVVSTTTCKPAVRISPYELIQVNYKQSMIASLKARNIEAYPVTRYTNPEERGEYTYAFGSAGKTTALYHVNSKKGIIYHGFAGDSPGLEGNFGHPPKLPTCCSEYAFAVGKFSFAEKTIEMFLSGDLNAIAKVLKYEKASIPTRKLLDDAVDEYKAIDEMIKLSQPAIGRTPSIIGRTGSDSSDSSASDPLAVALENLKKAAHAFLTELLGGKVAAAHKAVIDAADKDKIVGDDMAEYARITITNYMDLSPDTDLVKRYVMGLRLLVFHAHKSHPKILKALGSTIHFSLIEEDWIHKRGNFWSVYALKLLFYQTDPALAALLHLSNGFGPSLEFSWFDKVWAYQVPNRPEDKSKGPLDSFLTCETITDRDEIVKTFSEIVEAYPDRLLGQCNLRVYETICGRSHPFRIEEERDKAFEIISNTLYMAWVNSHVADFIIPPDQNQYARYLLPSMAQKLVPSDLMDAMNGHCFEHVHMLIKELHAELLVA